ncbi:MAG TPA: VWA domain-containing protein [Burkholderiales bacterium]|nr:VWA domain-containing protein [Burkholderiales bacterium]
MKFLWPDALWLLALLPLLVGLYLALLRRRKKAALAYSDLGLLRAALGRQSLRRHVPPALFLAALALMIVALARPAAVVTLPSQHETVILAMDVSGSMRADDVKPTRLAAAQAAARAFIKDTPKSMRIGLVSFAGSAALVQAPTQNRNDVLAAIEQLQLQNATAVGSGILASLKAIFPDQDFDVKLPSLLRGRGGPAAVGGSRPPSALGAAPKPEQKPVPPGSYKSAVIILLTDGQTTTGPDPVDAARLAAERGVRVFTVGVGTPDGQILTGEGWSIRVRLDEDALKVIADLTRGEYFFAGNAPDLKKIYEGLNSKLVMEKKETEITAFFTGIAALIALVAAGLSLLWFNRLL